MHDLKQSISLQLQNYTMRVNYYTWKLNAVADNFEYIKSSIKFRYSCNL